MFDLVYFFNSYFPKKFFLRNFKNIENTQFLKAFEIPMLTKIDTKINKKNVFNNVFSYFILLKTLRSIFSYTL